MPAIKIKNNLIVISDEQKDRDILFKRHYLIFLEEAKLNIEIEINMPKREIATIHPLNITFIPESFDKNSLFYATNNGGGLETFHIGNMPIDHSQNLSALISAKYGLGATEGVLMLGDKDKKISMTHNQTISSLIPSIYYLPVDDSFFLRVQYSAQEVDDTFKKDNTPVTINCLFSIE